MQRPERKIIKLFCNAEAQSPLFPHMIAHYLYDERLSGDETRKQRRPTHTHCVLCVDTIASAHAPKCFKKIGDMRNALGEMPYCTKRQNVHTPALRGQMFFEKRYVGCRPAYIGWIYTSGNE